MVDEAMAMARAQEQDRVLVLARAGRDVGVIGIVASRVQQEFYKPTVVIGIEDKLGKGSCRSVTGFSIVRRPAPLRAVAGAVRRTRDGRRAQCEGRQHRSIAAAAQ